MAAYTREIVLRVVGAMWDSLGQLFGSSLIIGAITQLILTYNKCQRDARLIERRYPKLELEYFHRREFIFEAVIKAGSLEELKKTIEPSKIPVQFSETKDLSLDDIAYEYSYLSIQVRGHPQWADPDLKVQGLRDRFFPINFGRIPAKLTEADLSDLKVYVHELQLVDQKNKSLRSNIATTVECGPCNVFRMAFGRLPQIVSVKP